MTDEEIKQAISHVVWDYKTDPWTLYECVIGKREDAGAFDRVGAFERFLTNLSWYTMIKIFGIELIREQLTEEVTRRIWPSSRREHFEDIRKILHGEPLPPAGWYPEFGKGPRYAFLSNRWNYTK
jgi:hypothetical protein